MTLKTKQVVIAVMASVFLLSLVFVQWMEVARKREEAGMTAAKIAVPAGSRACVDCHANSTPGITDQWRTSTHARKGVACVECHNAQKAEADSFEHYGVMIATVVTPMDCGGCHQDVYGEFESSHHAKAGNILASLDNFLAETVEGARMPFDPHTRTPGRVVESVDGMASVTVGCKQCHGSLVALNAIDGGTINVRDLQPDADGVPTNAAAVARIARNENGKPALDPATWPNTGIGRINLDGSLGSCAACHSRHDFSPRRARQPENCGKCHLGPDHPQKEIYEESKHGVAYRDLRDKMNLDGESWVLGEDYSQAPTCATCHMSAHTRNGRKVTHDPGERISWTNRPPVSLVMDTDINNKVITETDPAVRAELVVDSWQDKRARMKDVCAHCHTPDYINSFYSQYDDFVVLYNQKFAEPGIEIMTALRANNLITPQEFDEEIEWTWFYLWHHEGRRARHGASMMAPDYAHWHGMYEVAERFYVELVPQALEIAEAAGGPGGEHVEVVVASILARPEHEWFNSQRGALTAPQN